jgi:hypothetical protein
MFAAISRPRRNGAGVIVNRPRASATPSRPPADALLWQSFVDLDGYRIKLIDRAIKGGRHSGPGAAAVRY